MIILASGGVLLGRTVVGLSGERPPAAIQGAGVSVAAAVSAPEADAQAAGVGSASAVGAVPDSQPMFISSLRSWVAEPPPADGPAASVSPASASNSRTAGESSDTYVVAPGDTLSEIAEQHGVELDRLMRANQLTEGTTLLAGTRLTIPATGASVAMARPPRAQPAPVQVPGAPSRAGAASPDTAVRAFYGDLDQGRFDDAVGLWSARMRATYPPAEYLYHRFAATRSLSLRRADVVSLDAAGGRATVAIDLLEVVGSSTRHYVGRWYLVRGLSGWLLDQPALEAS